MLREQRLQFISEAFNLKKKYKKLLKENKNGLNVDSDARLRRLAQDLEAMEKHKKEAIAKDKALRDYCIKSTNELWEKIEHELNNK